jgi:hypothetical protein
LALRSVCAGAWRPVLTVLVARPCPWVMGLEDGTLVTDKRLATRTVVRGERVWVLARWLELGCSIRCMTYLVDGGHEKLPGDGHETARWRT